MTLMLFIVLLSVVTTLCYLFDYFYVNAQIWNAKFQDVNEKNMSHLLVSKSQKLSGKWGGGQKVIWSRTFNKKKFH